MMQALGRYLSVLVISSMVLCIGFSNPVRAQDRKGADDPRLTQPDSNFQPRTGTFHYLFELNGLNIGTGWLSMNQDKNLYKIQFNARTNERIDRFYRARYRGEGIMETEPLTPVRAQFYQKVKAREKDTTIYFDEGSGRIIAVETKAEEGEEPEDEVREIRKEGSVFDPISATYLIQGVDWELGEKKVFDIYTGKRRYEATFTCIDQEVIDVAGEKRNAWVITQQSRKLDEDQEEEPEKEEPGLRIYVSADRFRDVLKAETTRRIGHITLTLLRFEPASNQASSQDNR